MLCIAYGAATPSQNLHEICFFERSITEMGLLQTPSLHAGEMLRTLVLFVSL